MCISKFTESIKRKHIHREHIILMNPYVTKRSRRNQRQVPNGIQHSNHEPIQMHYLPPFSSSFSIPLKTLFTNYFLSISHSKLLFVFLVLKEGATFKIEDQNKSRSDREHMRSQFPPQRFVVEDQKGESTTTIDRSIMERAITQPENPNPSPLLGSSTLFIIFSLSFLCIKLVRHKVLYTLSNFHQ